MNCETIFRELKERQLAEIDVLNPVDIDEGVEKLNLDDKSEADGEATSNSDIGKEILSPEDGKSEPQEAQPRQKCEET